LKLTNTTQDIKYPNVRDHNKTKLQVFGEQIQYVQLQTCYLFTENEVHGIKNVTNFSLSSLNGLEIQHLNKNPCLKYKGGGEEDSFDININSTS
jgi:hypothetical protein